jgi:CRP/FNR family transcriptional regulator
MAEIVTFQSHAQRCQDCRYAEDCPLTDADGQPTEAVLHSRVRVLHQGDRLFREGAPIDALYRVRTGVVKTQVTDHDGGEQVSGFVGPGEWVGLESLGQDRYLCDAQALDTASVCVAPLSVLNERIDHSGRAGLLLIHAQSQRLGAQGALHMSLARDSAEQRLAGFLLDLSARRQRCSLDPAHLALPMSRADIASYLALAVETVSRLLTRMHKAGVLQVHRSHVEVLDHAALRALAARSPTRTWNGNSSAAG